MRHMHGASFGVSDLYVVCMMRPEGAAPYTLRIDPDEIEDACWMPADEYARTTRHPLTRHAALLATHELRREQARNARGGGGGGGGGETDTYAIAESDVFFAFSGRVSKVYCAAHAPQPERAAPNAAAAAATAAAAAEPR
jgi:hypothetical protein